MTGTLPYPRTLQSSPAIPDKAASILGLILLAYWPYALVLEAKTALHVLGFSFFVTVGPALLATLSLALLSFRRPRVMVIPLSMLGLVVIVVYARYFLGLSENNSVGVKDFVALRYYFLLPCFILVAEAAVRTPVLRLRAIQAIVVGGVIVAACGIADALGVLPATLVPTGPDNQLLADLGMKTRATGIFSGSNQLANFLVVPFMICALIRLQPWLRVSMLVLFLAGIFATGSRFALVSAAGAYLILTWGRRISAGKRALQVVAIGAALFIAPRVVVLSSTNVSDRFEQDVFGEDVSIRFDKAVLGTRALFADSATVTFGARPSAIVIGENANEQISDNGYIQVLTSSGIPASLCFGIFSWLLLRRRNMSSRQRTFLRVFWAITLFTAAVNNSIIWDINIFYVAVLYWLLIRFAEPQMVSSAGPVAVR